MLTLWSNECIITRWNKTHPIITHCECGNSLQIWHKFISDENISYNYSPNAFLSSQKITQKLWPGLAWPGPQLEAGLCTSLAIHLTSGLSHIHIMHVQLLAYWVSSYSHILSSICHNWWLMADTWRMQSDLMWTTATSAHTHSNNFQGTHQEFSCKLAAAVCTVHTSVILTTTLTTIQ
jgi:hypothetical protein